MGRCVVRVACVLGGKGTVRWEVDVGSWVELVCRGVASTPLCPLQRGLEPADLGSCLQGPRNSTRLQHSTRSDPLQIIFDKGLPVRTWRLRELYATIRGPHQDKADRVDTNTDQCSTVSDGLLRLPGLQTAASPPSLAALRPRPRTPTQRAQRPANSAIGQSVDGQSTAIEAGAASQRRFGAGRRQISGGRGVIRAIVLDDSL